MMADERSLLEVLEGIEDWRGRQGRDYPLATMFILLIGGLLAGRNNLQAIFRWGRGFGADDLRRIGSPHGKAPCHASYHYFLRDMPVERLEQALGCWVSAEAQPGEHLALDGKTLCGSATQDQPARHLVSVFAARLNAVTGQVASTRGGGEITAAKELLAGISLEGRIITGDAMFAQKDICQIIIDGSGDYIFAVKRNQDSTLDGIAVAFGDFSPLWQGGDDQR